MGATGSAAPGRLGAIALLRYAPGTGTALTVDGGPTACLAVWGDHPA